MTLYCHDGEFADASSELRAVVGLVMGAFVPAADLTFTVAGKLVTAACLIGQ